MEQIVDNVEVMKELAKQDAFISGRCNICVREIGDDGYIYFTPIVYGHGSSDPVEVQGTVGALDFLQNDPEYTDLFDSAGELGLYLMPCTPQLIGTLQTELKGELSYVKTHGSAQNNGEGTIQDSE